MLHQKDKSLHIRHQLCQKLTIAEIIDEKAMAELRKQQDGVIPQPPREPLHDSVQSWLRTFSIVNSVDIIRILTAYNGYNKYHRRVAAERRLKLNEKLSDLIDRVRYAKNNGGDISPKKRVASISLTQHYSGDAIPVLSTMLDTVVPDDYDFP